MTPGRPPLDLSLYLVTDTRLCGNRGVAATARKAVEAGATLVQVRDREASDDEFLRLGRSVVAALADTGVPVLVNDRVHLVAAIGAQGAHIGQTDMSVHEARRLLGPDAYVGLSIDHPDQLVRAQEEGARRIDYLGVGPVWAQSTKRDAVDPIGLDGLRAVTSASRWDCVAIGGVDVGRAAAVRSAGASGIAVVSAICGKPDVGAATRELAAAWARSRA